MEADEWYSGGGGRPDGRREAGRGKGMSFSGVEALFAEFEALYGSRFADMWRHTDVARMKSLWARALSGVSVGEIRTGLAGCRDLSWPPSLPEFMALCCPRPDPAVAFAQAQEQVSRRPFGEDVWPEKALYWAAVAFGFYDLRSMSWPQAKTRWTRIWTEKRGMEETLPPVPPFRKALVAPGKNETDTETARRHLADLKRLVGLCPGPCGRNGEADVPYPDKSVSGKGEAYVRQIPG